MWRRKNDGLYELGKFSIKAGKAIVSDPCYDRGTWCAGLLENVLDGSWTGLVLKSDEGNWGKRVAELIAHHDDYPLNRMQFKEKTDIDVGVDSGQAGIYCDTEFRGGEDDYGDGGWYDTCCKLTLDTSHHAGVLPGGVVSSSGYGDGGYDAFVERNEENQIIGIKLVFIPEYEETDENWDDETDEDDETDWN